ncbi:MAG: TrbI/VirB10 family protein [Pseudoxanthomonas sp.]
MSHHLPPGPSSPSSHQEDDTFTRGIPHPGSGNESNPYFANHPGAAVPDLDAHAPQLKSNEQQRLNRKALLFLGGIVLLLAVAAVWTFKMAVSGKEETARPREEKVVIPELPNNAGAAVITEPAEPIGLQEYPTETQIPPLPVESPAAYPQNFVYETMPQTAREPTLMERRMMNSSGSGGADGTQNPGQSRMQDPYLQAMLATLPVNQANSPAAPTPDSDAGSAQYLNRPDALLVRGTYIRCVLETRIITDIAGFTSCVVTEPVYSINGKSLLLPKGSKISGKYNNSGANGERVAVIWDRITTPNGIDVNMSSPGVDNLGGAGHPGKHNAHWGSRIASALMISLISDAFSYAAAENGPRTTTLSNGSVVETPFESSTARTMERLANQALDKSINRPPTVTINQGTVVNVYVSRDVDFSGVLAHQ